MSQDRARTSPPSGGTLTITDGIAPDFSEIAVGQIRGGGTGTFELAVIPVGTTAPADQENVTWPDNQAVDFTVSYSAASQMLSVSALGKTAESMFDLTGSNAMAIFARTFSSGSNVEKNGEFSITDLTLNGMALDDILPSATYSATVTGFDFGTDFSLAGSALFDFEGSGSQIQSNLAASFKFGSVPAVPLPASALLLLGGVGGLAAMRRRKA